MMTEVQIEIFARSIIRQECERFGSFPPLEDMEEFVRKAWKSTKAGVAWKVGDK